MATAANTTSGIIYLISVGSLPITVGKFGDGIATAPSITFASDTTLGFYKPFAGAIAVVSNAANPQLLMSADNDRGFEVAGQSTFSFSSNATSTTAAADLFIRRDGANILAQRNLANAQTFRIYNTFTDASNGEWFNFTWAVNQAILSTNSNGTGVNRDLIVRTSATGVLHLGQNATNYWQIPSGGALTSDSGLNGIAATTTDGILIQNTTASTVGVPVQYSPRLRFLGTAWNSTGTVSQTNSWYVEAQPSSVAGTTTSALIFTRIDGSGAAQTNLVLSSAGSLRISAGGVLGWNTLGGFQSPTDGVVTIANGAQTDFGRLQFGGQTASFPSIKRNGNQFDFRLADDSAYAGLTAAVVGVTASQATDGAGTGISPVITANIARQYKKVTIINTAFITAGLTSDITIATLPAKTILEGIYADLTQTFAGTAGTLAITVGSSAGATDILTTFDVKSATLQRGLADADLGTALARATATQAGKVFAWGSTTPISLRMTSGTGNIGNGATSNLSQGSITFYIVTTRFS